MPAHAAKIDSRSRVIVPQAMPFVVADYYDDKTIYLLSTTDDGRFTQRSKDAGNSVAGFGIVRDAAFGADKTLAAIYSTHRWLEGNCSGPSFKTDCWFLFDGRRVDLKDQLVRTTWSNGWWTREFALLRGEVVLWRIAYRRPWAHELLRGHRDSDLHGPDDFYCYVDWVSRTICQAREEKN
jgi:hypothetical protein